MVKYILCASSQLDFPGGSDGKASVYNAGDLGLSPGLGRSPGEGNGNPLQDSCLDNSMHSGAWWAAVHGSQESDTTERLTLSPFVFTDFGPALPYPQHGPSSPVPSPATAELLGVEGNHHHSLSLPSWQHQQLNNREAGPSNACLTH